MASDIKYLSPQFVELIQKMVAIGFNVSTIDKFKRLSQYVLDFDVLYGDYLGIIEDSNDPQHAYARCYNAAVTNAPGQHSEDPRDVSVTMDMVNQAEAEGPEKHELVKNYINEQQELRDLDAELSSAVQSLSAMLEDSSVDQNVVARQKAHVVNIEQMVKNKERYLRTINPFSLANLVVNKDDMEAGHIVRMHDLDDLDPNPKISPVYFMESRNPRLEVTSPYPQINRRPQWSDVRDYYMGLDVKPVTMTELQVPHGPQDEKPKVENNVPAHVPDDESHGENVNDMDDFFG